MTECQIYVTNCQNTKLACDKRPENQLKYVFKWQRNQDYPKLFSFTFQIIMMVGLPGAGKTTWVEKYIKENLEKKYYVLGTNFLIDKMKVNGLPRRRNYAGRWEVLIERCTKCLNKLLELSYKRRRNFIIDQVREDASFLGEGEAGGFCLAASLSCQELKICGMMLLLFRENPTPVPSH